VRHRRGPSSPDEPDPELTRTTNTTTQGAARWPFVALAAPVVFLTLSVIDGTHAIWAQIVGVVLVILVACAVVLVRWMWSRHRRLRLLPLVAVVLCSIAALSVMIAGNVEPTKADPPPPSSRPVATAPTPTRSPSTTALGCWSADRITIDCREPHRLERIPAEPSCELAAVVRFLGGTSVDVVTAQAVAGPGGSCALESADDVSGTARDVLLTSSSASWRRCFDRRTATTVNCAQVHSSEYFATGSLRRATSDECLAAAEIYLDQLPANVADDLAINVLPVLSGTQDRARCTIDARGNHLLTSTVRSLGASPVPVQTM
jgi:hypothetical protein